MSKIKGLAGDTILYGMGSIIPRFFSFLLVGLHTRVFDPAEYGIVTWLLSYTAVVNTLYAFGMETAYFRFATKQDANEKAIYNLTQSVVLLISGLGTVILIAFATQVAVALDVPGQRSLIIWLAVILLIDSAVAIPFARLRLKKKALAIAVGKFINNFIMI